METLHGSNGGKPLPCPHCSSGICTELRGPRSREYVCPDCNGTGHVACECGEPAVRTDPTDEHLFYCAACGEHADRDAAAYLASLCSAGQDHSWLKRNEQAWAALAYIGIQADEVETLELRNCACGSTICRVVAERKAA